MKAGVQKMKHVQLRLLYLKELVEQIVIATVKVAMDANPSDMLTKATDQQTFERCLSQVECWRRIPREEKKKKNNNNNSKKKNIKEDLTDQQEVDGAGDELLEEMGISRLVFPHLAPNAVLTCHSCAPFYEQHHVC